MLVPGFLELNSKLWPPFWVTVSRAQIYVRNRGSVT